MLQPVANVLIAQLGGQQRAAMDALHYPTAGRRVGCVGDQLFRSDPDGGHHHVDECSQTLTVDAMVAGVSRDLTVGHSVTRSLDHSITRSLGHSVTRSLGQSVTRSIGQSVNRSIGHLRDVRPESRLPCVNQALSACADIRETSGSHGSSQSRCVSRREARIRT